MLWNDDEMLRTELMLQSSPAAIYIGNVSYDSAGDFRRPNLGGNEEQPVGLL
jgi:hypothetical protein